MFRVIAHRLCALPVRFGRQVAPAWNVPDFRWWWLACALVTQGNRLSTQAAAYFLGSAGGGASAFGLLSGAQSFWGLALPPVMGAVGDRRRKRPLIMTLAALQLLPPLTLAALVTFDRAHSRWPVLVVILVAAFLRFSAKPPSGSYTFLLLHAGRLQDREARVRRQQGGSTLNSANKVAAKWLPHLAFPAIVAIAPRREAGLALAFAIGTVGYGAQLARLLLRRVEEPPAQRAAGGARGRSRWWKAPRLLLGDSRDALRYVHEQRPALSFAIAAEVLLSLMAFNINLFTPVLAFGLWQGHAGMFAWLMGSFGTGQFVGGWIPTEPKQRPGAAARDERLLGRLAAAAVALAGTLIASIVPLRAVEVVAFVAMGVATEFLSKAVENGLNNVGIPENAARLSSLQIVLYDGLTAIGAPAMGFVFALSGVAGGFLTAGAGAVVGAGILAYGRRWLVRARRDSTAT